MCTVSGLSAAHTIYLAGGNVLLLDKNSMPHSLKAARLELTYTRLLRRQ